MPIAEASDDVLAGQHGLKRLAVLLGDRVELGVAGSIDYPALAEEVELGNGLAGRLHLGESIEIAPVGRLPDLEIAPEVLRPFRHADPTGVLSALLVLLELGDPEVVRVVDRDLDAKDAPLVVELDPVLPDAVLDAAGWAASLCRASVAP
jgi:hypothetical protein